MNELMLRFGPTAAYFVGVLAVTAVVVAVGLYLRSLRMQCLHRQNKSTDEASFGGVIFTFVTGILVLFTGMFLPQISSKVRRIAFDANLPPCAFALLADGKARELPADVAITYAEYMDRFGGHIYSSEGLQDKVRMSVAPITDNPKVRHFVYDVYIIVGGTMDNWMTYKSQVLESGSPVVRDNQLSGKGLVKYCLYQFNEEKSKELAKFFNPYDADQQKKFLIMLREFLEPKLVGTGISISDDTGFRLE